MDDIVLTGDDHEEMEKIKKSLAKAVQVKDLGEMKYFLGIEVAQSKKGIYIYISKEVYSRPFKSNKNVGV